LFVRNCHAFPLLYATGYHGETNVTNALRSFNQVSGTLCGFILISVSELLRHTPETENRRLTPGCRTKPHRTVPGPNRRIRHYRDAPNYTRQLAARTAKNRDDGAPPRPQLKLRPRCHRAHRPRHRVLRPRHRVLRPWTDASRDSRGPRPPPVRSRGTGLR